MKKKIALALATILALSAMPMTIFAGSDNRINRDVQVVGEKAMFYYGDKYVDGDGLPKFFTPTSPTGISNARTYFKDPDFRKKIEGDQTYQASELIFKMKDNITSGSAFRLRLTNAQWLFNMISTGNEADIPTGSFTAPVGPVLNSNGVQINEVIPTIDDVADQWTHKDMVTYEFSDGRGNGTSPDFTFQMNPNKPEEATVTFNENITKLSYGSADEVHIPLTIFMFDENVDATVQVVDNTSSISVGNFAIASTKGGSTVNTARTIKSGREVIALDTLVFKENRVGSLVGQGAFEIQAPTGYEFQNDPSNWEYGYETGLSKLGGVAYIPTYKANKESYALAFTGIGTSNGTSAVNLPGAITISGVKLQPVDDDNIPIGSDLEMVTRTFEYDTTNFTNGSWKDVASVRSAKQITISDSLRVSVAMHSDPRDTSSSKRDIPDYMLSRDAYGAVKSEQSYKLTKLGVSAGSFKVAKAVDWKMSFRTDGTVPTLVAGRLNPYRADHAVHQSVKVVFEEEEVSAWLANRTTTFRLPDGVKIRGINWDAKTNIKGAVTPLKDLLGTEIEVQPSTTTKWTPSDQPALTIGENYFTLKDVATEKNGGENGGKVKLSFNLLLSIEPNYASDSIELAVEGTAIPEPLAPIEIAKVEKPITIETKTTDVQIGFQNYKVADVTIKETKPGYITKDGGLIVSIADLYNDRDVYFAPVKDSQVTVTGDLKVSLLKTTDGTISFDVDRPSSSTAAEIHITGLDVKIDRTVPYGTYDLVVYGGSVFNNYADIKEQNGRNEFVINPIVGFDTDRDGFIFEDFINVKTEGSNSALKSNVKVQADSATAIVDGKTVELGVAPINKNGRIMVPLKFMANVFGIEDNNINWYDGNMFNDPGNRVATITSGSTSVQFKIGSTTYKQFKNGAEVTKPIDSQGTAAFIDPVSNRIFLPFAAMGEAFDITVKWDEASKTAIYNPSVE